MTYREQARGRDDHTVRRVAVPPPTLAISEVTEVPRSIPMTRAAAWPKLIMPA